MSLRERIKVNQSEKVQQGVLRDAKTTLDGIKFSPDQPQVAQRQLINIAAGIGDNVGREFIVPTKVLPALVVDLFEESDNLSVTIQPEHESVLLTESDGAISKVAVNFGPNKKGTNALGIRFHSGIDESERSVYGYTHYESKVKKLRDLKDASRDPRSSFYIGAGILRAIVDTTLKSN